MSRYRAKSVPYTSYVAKLTQDGTTAPSVAVIENNIGSNLGAGAIVWARSGAGVYTGTKTGAFKNLKTLLEVKHLINAAGTVAITIERTSANVITVKSFTVAEGVATAADGQLSHFIEVRIYDGAAIDES